MKPLLASITAAVALAALTACGSATSSSAPVSPSSAPAAAAKAAPSPSCTLKTSYDYIVRTVEPGMQAQASEIGNVDYSECADSLADFQQTAGQADGECTSVARASDNPGYNADAVPAPPLKDVIESAGPGC